MVIWLAVKGYPVAVVYKEAKNFPDDFFGTIMSRFGVTPIKYKSDPTLMPVILKSLKEKKIILVQNDQSHPHGVYINFYNKSVPSLAGPALLSLRKKVPIIPAYIIRDTHDHHNLTILPEMDVVDSSDRQEFIMRNTQLQLDWIAKILETHPTEWLWLHNRWKRARQDDHSSHA
jgi:KDO2-lipid IV(A) lauroyltransferase